MREDIEHLSGFVVGIRDSAQALVDACNVFLNYLETVVTGVPQDPSAWDNLEWEQRESAKGFKFEMLRIDEENELHRQLRAMLRQKHGKLTIEPYRYSLGREAKVIFRNILKGTSAK